LEIINIHPRIPRMSAAGICPHSPKLQIVNKTPMPNIKPIQAKKSNSIATPINENKGFYH
jgi:hypothetical protein